MKRFMFSIIGVLLLLASVPTCGVPAGRSFGAINKPTTSSYAHFSSVNGVRRVVTRTTAFLRSLPHFRLNLKYAKYADDDTLDDASGVTVKYTYNIPTTIRSVADFLHVESCFRDVTITSQPRASPLG